MRRTTWRIASPVLFYLLNAPQEITAGSVGGTTMLSEDLALDISFGGDADQAANVVFQYTRAGDVTPVDGVVHGFPESFALVGPRVVEGLEEEFELGMLSQAARQRRVRYCERCSCPE